MSGADENGQCRFAAASSRRSPGRTVRCLLFHVLALGRQRLAGANSHPTRAPIARARFGQSTRPWQNDRRDDGFGTDGNGGTTMARLDPRNEWTDRQRAALTTPPRSKHPCRGVTSRRLAWRSPTRSP